MKNFLSFATNYILLIGFIALVAWNCQKSGTHPKQTVPLNAVFHLSAMIFSQGGILEHASGSGSVTPIGNADIEDDRKINISVSTQIVTGVDTITGMNGDKIYSTFRGNAIAPDAYRNFQVSDTAMITGGTGKYAGATGGFTITINGNINKPTADAAYAGTITY